MRVMTPDVCTRCLAGRDLDRWAAWLALATVVSNLKGSEQNAKGEIEIAHEHTRQGDISDISGYAIAWIWMVLGEVGDGRQGGLSAGRMDSSPMVPSLQPSLVTRAARCRCWMS